MAGRPAGRARAQVGSDAGTVTGGTVEVRELGSCSAAGTVHDGAVDVTLPRYVIPGRHTLTVRYLGTAEPNPPDHDHPDLHGARADSRTIGVPD